MLSFLIPTKNGYDNQNVVENLLILRNSILNEFMSESYNSFNWPSSEIPQEILNQIEIITIGDLACNKEDVFDYFKNNIKHIEFDGNISEKLNLGFKVAGNKYTTWIRDYMFLYPGYIKSWYNFIKQNEFDIGMNIVLNKDGSRFRDWCNWDNEEINYGEWTQYEPFCPEGRKYYGRPCLVPYDYYRTNKAYVSGGYFLARKQFMLDNPFDEKLSLCMGEDVEWSLRVRDKWKLIMNTGATVGMSKQKDVILPCITN